MRRRRPPSLFAEVAAIVVLQANTLGCPLGTIKFAGLVGLQHARIGSSRGAPVDGLHSITSGNETGCGANQMVHFVGSRHDVCLTRIITESIYSI